MRQGGKGHKGKGLTVPIVNIIPQVSRLERDTCRRTEGETMSDAKESGVPRARHDVLKPQGVHFRPFEVPVLPRVAKALIEPPRLLRQRPNQAFSCRHDLRLVAKHWILKRQGRVNPLPAGLLEGRQYIRQDVGIQRVKMEQDCVPNIASQNFQRKLTIERRAIEQMRDEVVAIRGYGSVGFLPETINETLAHIPVRGINGDVADAISAFLEQRSKTIALLDGIPLLQERVPEQRFPIAIGSNH